MRILFLASYFPRPLKPQIGTWALEQAKALARHAELQVFCCTPYVPSIFGVLPKAKAWVHVPRTHQWENVSVQYAKGLYYPIPPFNARFHTHPCRQMEIAWKSIERSLIDTVQKFSPEIIYAHHTAVNGYFAERLFRKTGLPYVITDHDFAEINDCARYPARHSHFSTILRTAKYNICVSTRMEADMRRIFPDVRATTVYNGINAHPPEIFSTPRPAELDGKTIILSAGMFTPRKGFPLLIKAFGKIAQKHPNALLRIAGDGKQRSEIEKTIQQLGLTGRVQLLGLLPQKRVFQEMAWCDLFALIAWDEPFATVFIEAMGTGKPILTASDGGINDVVRDRVHGLVVPPKDMDAAAAALDELLSNDDARRTMGQNARALVDDQLTWDANSRKMMQIFAATNV